MPVKERILFDMDGTLARFQKVENLELLFEKGYFFNLEPMNSVIGAVREIKSKHPDIEVFIISAVLQDSQFALEEKNAWLDKYLPEIDKEHRIFPPCGENKADYVPGGIKDTDFLVDDYTKNLVNWEPPAKGIKLLNGINNTNGTWTGVKLRYDKPPKQLAADIMNVVLNKELMQDELPMEQRINILNERYERGNRSTYISEQQRENLVFLEAAEAKIACELGIHICKVYTLAEYHHMNIEFLTEELTSLTAVKNLYETQENEIEHKACISPFYDDADYVKEILQKEMQEENPKINKKELNKIPKL